MMPLRLAPLLAAAAAVALATAGCGGGSATAPLSPSHRADAFARRLLAPGIQTVPAPGPSGRRAPAGAVAVIRGWSAALRSGHLRRAASYFALPSVMINGGAGSGGLALRIDTAAEAASANETLPCGARFLSADQRGPYVNALFRLTGRTGPGGSGCGSGAGQTARTNFVIADGRIVEWIRAPDDPGDNGTPAAAPTSTGPLI